MRYRNGREQNVYFQNKNKLFMIILSDAGNLMNIPYVCSYCLSSIASVDIEENHIEMTSII